MILPKNIWTLLEEKQPVSIPTTDTLSPVRFSTEGQLSSEECTRLVDWILVNEEQHPCLKEWLEFLRRYRQTFTDIAKGMGRWNDESTHSLGHDKWAVGWASARRTEGSISSTQASGTRPSSSAREGPGTWVRRPNSARQGGHAAA